MTRGRRPKPTAMKVLAGNPGHRPLPKDEPLAPPGIPDCPAHLNEEARAEWGRITAELAQLGLITRVDRSALAAYCVAWSRWVEAETQIAQFGLLMKTKAGMPQQSPYVGISNRAMEQMRKLLVEFGLTPSSRSRVGGARKPQPGNSFGRNGRFLQSAG